MGSRDEVAERIALLLHGIMRGLHAKDRGGPPDPDITVGQLHCLRQIDRLGAPGMGDLAEHLHLSPSTATGLVDALVARGLVERVEDPEDRRVVRVTQTAEGERRRDEFRRAKRQRLAQSLAGLGDADLERIEAALRLLEGAVTRTPDTAQPASASAKRSEE